MNRTAHVLFGAAVALGMCLVGAALARQAESLTRVVPPASANAARGVSFADITAAAGLTTFRHVSGSPTKPYVFEVTGSGVALWDHDGDGDTDIYLLNGGTFDAGAGQVTGAASGLFRNNGDLTFTDVAAAAGVTNQRWGQGVCAGDFDNDGRQDLYVANLGRNRLYRAKPMDRFDDVAVAAGVAVDGWSTGCAFGDYDGDGWLDLFVAGYVALDFARLPPAPRGGAPTPSRPSTAARVAAWARPIRLARPSAPIAASR